MPARPRKNIYGETSVDRYLGLMFLGLAVTAFILLSVMGMRRVETSAQQATANDGPPPSQTAAASLGPGVQNANPAP
jgi:hypothetical protein